MTVAAAMPVARATAALYEYLSDSSHGIAAALTSIRTALSLTTAAIPAPAIIVDWTRQGARETHFPAVEFAPVSIARDVEANQRIYGVTITLAASLISANVTSGGIDDLRRAAWAYVDAVYACIQNRARGEQGNTLANGGTGIALGRVIRCTVEDAEVRWDDSEIQIAQAVIRLRIDIAEDY